MIEYNLELKDEIDSLRRWKINLSVFAPEGNILITDIFSFFLHNFHFPLPLFVFIWYALLKFFYIHMVYKILKNIKFNKL